MQILKRCAEFTRTDWDKVRAFARAFFSHNPFNPEEDKELHAHQCESCGYLWAHARAEAMLAEVTTGHDDHVCPKCGDSQYDHYEGNGIACVH